MALAFISRELACQNSSLLAFRRVSARRFLYLCSRSCATTLAACRLGSARAATLEKLAS